MRKILGAWLLFLMLLPVCALAEAEVWMDSEKIVLGDVVADLYVPQDNADPHYLFWSDDDNGVFFSLKVHGDSSVILDIASSVSLVKSTN